MEALIVIVTKTLVARRRAFAAVAYIVGPVDYVTKRLLVGNPVYMSCSARDAVVENDRILDTAPGRVEAAVNIRAFYVESLGGGP